MKHPYAEILQAIINGEEIQFLNEGADEWATQSDATTLNEISYRAYQPTQYRVKPKTIRIGDFDVPEPMQKAPEAGKTYYVPALAYADGYETVVWDGCKFDLRHLEGGLAHSTKEAASLHQKALASLTKVK